MEIWEETKKRDREKTTKIPSFCRFICIYAKNVVTLRDFWGFASKDPKTGHKKIKNYNLKRQRDNLKSQRDNLKKQSNNLKRQRDNLKSQSNNLKRQRDNL